MKNNQQLLMFLIMTSVFFAGLRGNVGTDSIAYRTYYLKVGSSTGETVFEPIFLILAEIGNLFNLSSQFLIFSVSAAQGFFLYLTLKKIKEKDFFYLIYITVFYIYFAFNLIRVGLAICILVYAFTLKWEEKKLTLPVLIGGIMTHVSIALTLIAFSKKWYRAIPVAAGVLLIFQEFFLLKLFSYFLGVEVSAVAESLGIGFVASMVIIIYCITTENKWSDRALRVSFIFYIGFKLLIYVTSAFDRISIVFGLPLFLILLRDRVKPRTRLALTVLILYNLYGSLSFISNSDAAMERVIAKFPGVALLYSDTRWVPYEFFWK